MNILALILLAFAMSMDAFAASIAKGTKIQKPGFPVAIKTGLVFGMVEAITPLIGWLAGKAASSYIEAWDHWIALVLLVGLGAYMVYESLDDTDEKENDGKIQPFYLLLLTAIGTSIDAMAVGVSLAFIDVNIALAAALIGIATFVMVTIGVMVGGAIGSVIGRKAETFGGFILILVGIWLFLSHVL